MLQRYRGGAPVASEPQEARGNADLGDVLWIGGALVAVVAAIGITLLVLRRRPQS